MTKTYNTTRELVIGTELPQETRTYKPISHQQLIDLTMESIYSAGFKLDKESYTSARDGNIANGRYTISNVMDSEMQLEIGWQNSYNKSLSLKFAIGTRIMICQNGCVSGDFGAFKKKHKGDVQEFTPSAITEYIKRSGDVFQRMQKDRDVMKQVEITKRTKAELIGRMLIEESFINSTQINVLAREIETPTHDYGAPDSMWELYNYATFAMKETHPLDWMDNHMKAHSFFVNESGIIVPNMIVNVPNEGELKQLEIF